MPKRRMDNNSHPALDYNHITDGIYIGTNQCCRLHFDEKLLSQGIEADVSLEENRIDEPFGVSFYVWMPVVNHTSPSENQLNFGVGVLEKLVSMKKKVYVHCKNGHGRAPTLVAAYLIRKGLSPSEAEEFIKSKRPSIHLEDVQRASLENFK